MMKSNVPLLAALRVLISTGRENPLYRKVFVPSFFIFLALSGTIVTGFSFFLNGEVQPAGVMLLVLACAVFPPVYRNALKVGRVPGDSMIHGNVARVAVLLALTGALSALLCVRMQNTLAADSPSLGHGRWIAQVDSVIEKRYYREAGISFYGSKDDDSAPGGHGAPYRGLARITGGSIGQGDTIRFSARPVTVTMRNGGSPSPNHSLLRRGIRYVFYLDGGSIAVVKPGASYRERARYALAGNCDRLFNRETSSMVKALYFGNQDFIAKTTMNDFKRAGVFHILSAGGLHVGVIAAIPLFLLGIVRINRRIIMGAAVIAVFLYLCMTDEPVCLLRSCIMFFMFAAQRIAGREVNIFNTLFLSGAAILFMFPHEIFGLGFQLSYGATLGILLFHGSYRKTLAWLPGFISNPLALTISAQLLVLPVLLVRLNELNLMGLLSNIIVVPLMSLLLIASLAAHALSAITVVAEWAGRAVNVIYGMSDAIVRFLSGLDGHFFVTAAAPSLVAAFILLAAPLIPSLRAKKIMSLSLAAAVAIAWLTLGAGKPRESITVLRHGAGVIMLVKKGSSLSIAGQVPEKGSIAAVMRIIAASSPREVELHITDPDYRNMAGYTTLLKRLPVRRCVLSDTFRIRGYSRRFMDILERDRVSLVIHDCGVRAGNEDTSAGQDSPYRICRLYRKAAAGEIKPPAGALSKNDEIQYLTLH